LQGIFDLVSNSLKPLRLSALGTNRTDLEDSAYTATVFQQKALVIFQILNPRQELRKPRRLVIIKPLFILDGCSHWLGGMVVVLYLLRL